jgi:hypothetical protein
MNEPGRDDLEVILGDARRIEAALRRAVRAAIEQHRRAGRPVAVWGPGRVEWIEPERLPLEDDPS